MEIGYWKIRGLAAPLRMMLRFTGTEHTDVQYASEDEWFGAAKDRLKALNPLANLPYVIDDDGSTCVCQSNAVFVYVGEKLGIYRGIRDLELLSEIYDLRNTLIELSYPFYQICGDSSEFEVKAKRHCENIGGSYYDKLEAALQEPFFLGDEPSVCDFHVWEIVDQHEALTRKHGVKATLLDDYPKLQAFHARFKALPQLRAYFDSPDYNLDINDRTNAGAYFY
ncbi:hypothetical protein CTAYLR_003462 [Chrysophaeum taylorii]|uniref:glutathione transferase n=1 Tax=Chrysophaeum taylorii TaxID=2483200 RepID=A0AAD7U971_9STRA|nr:hypothetical protein CTAYLR_003462 [Chrysophaeum taylorii]